MARVPDCVPLPNRVVGGTDGRSLFAAEGSRNRKAIETAVNEVVIEC